MGHTLGKKVTVYITDTGLRSMCEECLEVHKKGTV